jgi:hypothetical protein
MARVQSQRQSKKEKKNPEALLPTVNNNNNMELQNCEADIISDTHLQILK